MRIKKKNNTLEGTGIILIGFFFFIIYPDKQSIPTTSAIPGGPELLYIIYTYIGRLGTFGSFLAFGLFIIYLGRRKKGLPPDDHSK